MFTLLFGVSIFGIAVTVAGFMAGLGCGSLVGARLARTVKHPMAWFALVEGALGLFAFTLPSTVASLDHFLTAMTAGASLGVWYGVEVIAVFLLMALPAFAMGLGFALAIGFARGISVRLGIVYGLNTIGGVLGALLPLVLLPLAGWTVSLRLAALMGFLVAVLALLLAFFSRRSSVAAQEAGTSSRPPWLDLLAYAIVGAAALMLQIGWIRLYGMILLRTEYVLAILLAVFLAGVGLGSLVAHRIRHGFGLAAVPLAAGFWAVLGLWLVPALGGAIDGANYRSLNEALGDAAIWIAFLTLPVTFGLGALLPLLVDRLKRDDDSVGVWLYGANALGAAVGALAAAFVFTPMIGTPGTILLAAVLLAGAGSLWVKGRVFKLVPIALLIAGVPVWAMPSVAELLPRSQKGTHDVFVHEDAIAVTHVVDRPSGERLLLADLQRMDASSDPTAVAAQANQARLPLLLHPAPKTVLFLGLGTGVTAAGSLPFPELKRVAVELSEGSVQAARNWFVPVNGHVMDAMTVVRDDARRFLRADGAVSDVIVGDLFHPDLAGRSALLSRQQFERAKARLGADGVFVQWIALNQFDPAMLDVVLRTFGAVFPDATLFLDGFRLGMVGTKKPVQAADMLANLARMGEPKQNEATGSEGAWTWLGRYWGRIPRSDGPIQDEWAPMIEFHLPSARYHRGADLPRLMEKLLAFRPTVAEAAAQLSVAEGQRESFELAYVATELGARGLLAGLLGRDDDATKALRLAFQANPKDRWAGFAVADRIFASITDAEKGPVRVAALERVLAARGDHVEALRGLWHLAQASGDLAIAEQWRTRLSEASPLDQEIRRK